MIITNRNTGDLSFVVNLCTVICTNNADILLNLSAPFSFTVSLCYVVRTADLKSGFSVSSWQWWWRCRRHTNSLPTGN